MQELEVTVLAFYCSTPMYIAVENYGGKGKLPFSKKQIIVNKCEVAQPLVLQPVSFLQMDMFKHVPAPLTLGDAAGLT